MNDFTFICVCYNQEKMITEHLDSIKDIIIAYGTEIKNDLIIADDCSKDGTVETVRNWVRENGKYFNNISIMTSSVNIGTVKNILRAVDECKTKEFKILAGDDKYALNNIYEIYDGIGESIIISPVIPFGIFADKYKQLVLSFKRSYRLLMHYNSKNNIGELIRFRNYLFAPGIFIKSDYWRSKEVRELLENFKYVEDIPMWMLLINQKKIPVVFCPKAYVYYRINVNTTLKGNKDISIRNSDHQKMRAMFPQRLLDKNKYFKFVYYKYFLNKVFYSYSTKYDKYFSDDETVKKIYIDSIK